ncbi:hypothetical protein PInf_010852 [Phytophthora infestans]|nr:hypothetical protein PInf_010852 [Phytophthora infestans]
MYFLLEYNFEVKYKPGRLNVVSDALSRRPDDELAHVTTVTSSVPDLIRGAYAQDDMCVALLRDLSSQAFEDSDKELSGRLRARLHRNSLDGGQLYNCTDSEDNLCVVAPHDEDLKYRILYEVHDTPVGGYVGREKTYGSEHTVFANLPPAQQDALTKLMSLLGPEGVAPLASQGPEAVTARLESFSRYENALLEHVQEKMSAATAAASMTREESMRLKPLMVSVKTFEGKDGENLLLWTREVEMAMGSAVLQSEHQRVALAISRLGGHARERALTCGTSVDAAFPTWDQLKQQLSRVFAPPNQAYRVRSKFLATRQGKKEILDYVQELRTLIAGMAADPLPELVSVTVFMEGLRVSAARTEVFRVHPNAFEEAVNVALNAEHNFRSARPGWSASSASSSSGPEPMDLSYAVDEEAELLTAEQRAGIRRCFVCYSTKHLRSVCKPGLLVVQANVKGFAKPWRVLIDSGASGSYARSSTLEGSQLYAEALEVPTRDTISVRLATGTLVTVSKVSVDLGVKFENFDSVKRCLVLDLDARYDLILGVAWLERHEPWIDWKSKTLGASHPAPSRALHEAEAAVVLDIGMSEIVSNEVAVCPEGVRGAARYPLSGAGQVDDQLLGPGEDQREWRVIH